MRCVLKWVCVCVSCGEQQQQEKERAMANEVVAKITSSCWDKCVDKPGSKFSSSETSCLSNCALRYMDMTMLIMKRFQQQWFSLSSWSWWCYFTSFPFIYFENRFFFSFFSWQLVLNPGNNIISLGWIVVGLVYGNVNEIFIWWTNESVWNVQLIKIMVKRAHRWIYCFHFHHNLNVSAKLKPALNNLFYSFLSVL